MIIGFAVHRRGAILGGQLIKSRRCIEISVRRVLLPLDMFIVQLLNGGGQTTAILILLLVIFDRNLCTQNTPPLCVCPSEI